MYRCGTVIFNFMFIVALCVGGCVMRTVYEREITEAAKIECAIVQGTARLCNSAFGRACKGIWPVKTAEELASRVGCAVRTAAYELSGEREPSARSIAVLIVEITKR